MAVLAMGRVHLGGGPKPYNILPITWYASFRPPIITLSSTLLNFSSFLPRFFFFSFFPFRLPKKVIYTRDLLVPLNKYIMIRSK